MRAVIVGHIINNKNLVSDYIEAATNLEKLGIEPVNPASEIVKASSIESVVSKYIDLMDGCDSIYFTKNWIDCPCARVLNNLSIASKKNVIYHNDIELDTTTIISEIISSVELVTGYGYAEIIKCGRKREYHFIRLMMVNLLDSRCNLSNNQIKGIINRYNLPTTYYLRSFKTEMNVNKEFRGLYEEIEKHLNRIVSQ